MFQKMLIEKEDKEKSKSQPEKILDTVFKTIRYVTIYICVGVCACIFIIIIHINSGFLVTVIKHVQP